MRSLFILQKPFFGLIHFLRTWMEKIFWDNVYEIANPQLNSLNSVFLEVLITPKNILDTHLLTVQISCHYPDVPRKEPKYEIIVEKEERVTVVKEIDEPAEPVNPNWPPKETVDKPSKINEKKRKRKKEKVQEEQNKRKKFSLLSSGCIHFCQNISFVFLIVSVSLNT